MWQVVICLVVAAVESTLLFRKDVVVAIGAYCTSLALISLVRAVRPWRYASLAAATVPNNPQLLTWHRILPLFFLSIAYGLHTSGFCATMTVTTHRPVSSWEGIWACFNSLAIDCLNDAGTDVDGSTCNAEGAAPQQPSQRSPSMTDYNLQVLTFARHYTIIDPRCDQSHLFGRYHRYRFSIRTETTVRVGRPV